MSLLNLYSPTCYPSLLHCPPYQAPTSPHLKPSPLHCPQYLNTARALQPGVIPPQRCPPQCAPGCGEQPHAVHGGVLGTRDRCRSWVTLRTEPNSAWFSHGGPWLGHTPPGYPGLARTCTHSAGTCILRPHSNPPSNQPTCSREFPALPAPPERPHSLPPTCSLASGHSRQDPSQ